MRHATTSIVTRYRVRNEVLWEDHLVGKILGARRGPTLWERSGLIFAVGPRTCSGPSVSLGAPKKGAQDPAAKWAVIRTPAESSLSPSALREPYSEVSLLLSSFRRRLKPLTLLGPPVMIWPHETTSSAVDSSCNNFASRLLFFLFTLSSLLLSPSFLSPRSHSMIALFLSAIEKRNAGNGARWTKKIIDFF